MSELAFSITGEPFDLPPTMAAWRVKKLKPKGAPEVVFGSDGVPLILPLDADIEDLRREARGEGRYRLEPVDEQSRTVPGSTAAHVCVPKVEQPSSPPPPPPSAATMMEATAQLVGALLESQKQHTEMARMYFSQFPVLVESLSGVLRAAGDSGLTTRVPLVIPAMPEAKPEPTTVKDDEDEDDEEDDDDYEDDEDDDVPAAPPAPEDKWAPIATRFLNMVEPIAPWLATMVPGLMGQLNKPGTKAPAPTASAAQPPEAAAEPSVPELLAHVAAVRAALTPPEAALAAHLADELPIPAQLAWAKRLYAMPVAEAVGVVRAELADLERARVSKANDAETARRAARQAAASEPTAAPPRRARPAAQAPANGVIARPTQGPATQSPAAPTPTQADPATGAHIAAIQAGLTADECTVVRARFAALSPTDRDRLIGSLLMLPVSEGIATVRAVLCEHPAPASVAQVDSTATEAAPVAHAETARAVDSAPAEETRTPPAPATEAPRTVIVPATAPAMSQRNAEPAQRAGSERVAQQPTPPAPPVVAAPSDRAAPSPLTVPPPADSPTRNAEPPRLVESPPPTARRETAAENHLLAIERTLSEDERARVNALIGGLSPEDGTQWIDTLLSMSIPEGAAFLRDAIGELATLQEAAAEVHLDETGDTDAEAAQEGDEDDDQDDDQRGHGEARDARTAQADATARGAEPSPAPPRAGAVDTSTANLVSALPTLDAAGLAHFRAVEHALTFRERMILHELAAQRSATELRAVVAMLMKLSVPEAVAKIRELLVAFGAPSNPTTREDVS